MLFQDKSAKNKVNNSRGFTLIEFLISASVVLFLTSLLVPNFQTGKDQFALQRSVHKLTQDIRRVQEMAMSVQQIGPEGAKFYPEGGFGIHFDLDTAKSYVIFADCDEDRYYDKDDPNGCGAGLPEKLASGDIVIEPKVRISGLTPSSPLDITFVAPNPDIYISGAGAEAKITLSLASGQARTVMVNQAGLVAEE